LVHVEAIEEALNDNNGFAFGRGTMEIEKHQRFAESSGEAVPRLRLVDGSAGIGDQEAILIVNRYYNTALHGSLAAVVPDSKIPGDIGVNAPLG
jgi:hypothetical protein